MILFISLTVLTFLTMEFVAWSVHKYVMHGFLWFLHKDHHVKSRKKAVFELNDWFFVIFALPGISLIYLGTVEGVAYALPIGLGITLYGFSYFFVHDIFIHQRIKWLRNTQNMYFKAARRAHKMHHKHIQKEDGECFGMLFYPYKYLKSETQKT